MIKARKARIWEYWTPPPSTPMVLDNLGLTVSVGMLKATPAYRESHRRLFGHGRLGRWWMHVVFPRIRPQEWELRRVEFERCRAIMQQEFISAVMDKTLERTDGQ